MSTLYTVLIAVLILGVCIFGMCFNIIFKKDGKFPDGEIGRNKELRKRGIICMREEDEKIWGKSAHIRVTKRGSRVKREPDEECIGCTQNCSLKELIGK
ncbi:MAG: hypothetical protein J5604_00675 [Bacteroidales bacterium]|nr:hypothetical protein [Bacteroidales bacterium]